MTSAEFIAVSRSVPAESFTPKLQSIERQTEYYRREGDRRFGRLPASVPWRIAGYFVPHSSFTKHRKLPETTSPNPGARHSPHAFR
jgi:hypothetical protein